MAVAQSPPDTGWPHYGNDSGGSRYSTLGQINRANKSELRVAWSYRTRVLELKTDLLRKAAFEATPILVDGTLFVSTPFNHVIALNPQSGAELWKYNPRIDVSHGYAEVTSRGGAAWQDTSRSAHQPCALRIFVGTIDARLIALDGSEFTRRRSCRISIRSPSAFACGVATNKTHTHQQKKCDTDDLT